MRVWVWVGLLWTDRVRLVLEHYGDRITDVSIFSQNIELDGSLTQTFDPATLDPYRAKWPHLRFWLGIRNNGYAPVFTALRENASARARLVADCAARLDAYPWLHGIDVDLEQGGGSENAAGNERIFRQVADLAHARGLECSAALPPLTSTGSVGGENWVRYKQLGQILDRAAIMSYDFAWAGSAPGPISPGFWMRDVYDWVVSQMPPGKVMMGLPLYGQYWQIHNYPDALGRTYRGDSGSYYVAWQAFTGYRAWDGTDANPDGSGSHHHIGWLAFRDPDSMSAYGFLDVYDWRHAPDWDTGTADGITADVWEGRPYTVRYGHPSGSPLWSVADNSSTTAGADYTLTPRRVRSTSGDLVAPKVGYTLTVELLKRLPVAATIIDDNAGTEGQLDAIYDVASGSWSRWASTSYYQYRGHGELDFSHDFTGSAVYLQIRGQFASSGWAGVTACGITAEVSPAGTIRLRQGSTVLGTASVSSRPVGQDPASGQFVLGLRVREGSARAYFGLSEAYELTTVLKVAATPSGGTVGIVSDATVWIDHVYLGDGWWYQPREAVELQAGGQTKLLGRIARTGITWDGHNRFKPDSDVDEAETRTDGVSLDWVYDHWVDAPLTTDTATAVRVRAVDHDVWVGRVIALDRDGATVAYWSDAETVAHWADRARLDWGVSGVAMWTLGQEDVRTWDRLAGGELPPGTKRLNV